MGVYTQSEWTGLSFLDGPIPEMCILLSVWFVEFESEGNLMFSYLLKLWVSIFTNKGKKDRAMFCFSLEF